jgi:hypothetical protein
MFEKFSAPRLYDEFIVPTLTTVNNTYAERE